MIALSYSLLMLIAFDSTIYRVILHIIHRLGHKISWVDGGGGGFREATSRGTSKDPIEHGQNFLTFRSTMRSCEK